MEGLLDVELSFELNNGGRLPSKFEKFGGFLETSLMGTKKAVSEETKFLDYQIEAVGNVRDQLAEEDDSQKTIEPVLVVAPTGSGKSGMITLLPYILKAKKVLIITPSKVISQQIGRAFGLYPGEKSFFEEAMLSTNRDFLNEILEAVKLIKKSSEIMERPGNLVVVNAQKFGGRSGATLSLVYQNEDIIKDVRMFFAQFDLLMVDEAHHFPAKTWKNIVETFSIPAKGLEKKIVFFTATPFRKDGKGKQVQILDRSRVAFEIKTSEIEGRTIRKTEFVEKTVTGSNGKRIDAIKKSLPRHIAKAFAVQEQQENRFKHQAMIIVKTRKEADEYQNLLNQSSGKQNYAVSIHGTKSKVNREIKKFNEGKYQVAVICGLLREGYDNPRVSICVILRTIRSRALFTQFIGRCMRINRTLKGDETDKTEGIVLSYSPFGQQKMWNKRNQLSEEDPSDDDIELVDDMM